MGFFSDIICASSATRYHKRCLTPLIAVVRLALIPSRLRRATIIRNANRSRESSITCKSGSWFVANDLDRRETVGIVRRFEGALALSRAALFPGVARRQASLQADLARRRMGGNPAAVCHAAVHVFLWPAGASSV